MARIVVTGASGFIGRMLVPVLAAAGHQVVQAGRRPGSTDTAFVDIGAIDGATDWSLALRDADAVAHLAGLAHRTGETAEAFHNVNDAGTRRLAEACATAGVRAVVAVSSIAARAVGSEQERASAYGRSKLAGEAHVTRFAEAKERAGIILRPPLVYGHDAPANWHALQRLADTALPLPFGGVRNRRSLCAVENLCEAIVAAIDAGLRGEGSGCYEVSDAEIVSLADIVSQLRRGMGRPARLVPVPPVLLRLGGAITGKSELVSTLLDDIFLDPQPFMRRFGWTPRVASLEGIAESGRRFAQERRPR